MFCPHCGKQLPDGSEFCSVCGTAVASSTGATTRETVAGRASAGRTATTRAAQPTVQQTNPIPHASRRTTAAIVADSTAGGSSRSAGSADGRGGVGGTAAGGKGTIGAGISNFGKSVNGGGVLVKVVAVAIAAAALWILVSWGMGIANTLDAVVSRLSVLEAPQAVTAAVVYATLGLIIALVSLRTIIVVLRPLMEKLYPARALSHALACGIALAVLAIITIALPGLMGGFMPIGFSSQHAQAAIAIGVEPVSVPTFLGAVLVTALSAVGRFVLRENLADKYGLAYGPKPQEGTYAAEQWEKARRRHRTVAALIAGAVVVAIAALAILIGTGTIPLPELPWSTASSSQSTDDEADADESGANVNKTASNGSGASDSGAGGGQNANGTTPNTPPPASSITNGEMAQQATDVREVVHTINARYADSEGTLSEADAPAAIADVVAYAEAHHGGLVDSYEVTDTAVLITLQSGLMYLYEPRIAGLAVGGSTSASAADSNTTGETTDSGSSSASSAAREASSTASATSSTTSSANSGASMNVITYEPFAQEGWYDGIFDTSDDATELYNSLTIKPSLTEYDGLVDYDGQYLALRLTNVNYRASDERDDDQVTVDSCMSFGPNQIVLWEGHGNWTQTTHGVLSTGETSGSDGTAVDTATYFQWVFACLDTYRDDINAGRLLISSDDRLVVTTAFFDYYYDEGDLDGTVFYLASCCDMMDDELANVLVSKGARAVLGYTNSATYLYIAASRDEFIAQMAKGATFEKALNAVNAKVGASDPFRTDAAESAQTADSSSQSADAARLVLYPADVSELTLVPSDKELEEYATGSIESAEPETREVVMALSVSSGMEGTPLVETVKAANSFAQTMLSSADTRVSLVAYSSSATTLVAHSAGAGRVRSALNSLKAGGQTNIEGALNEAKALFDDSASEHKVLVLMSDGMPNVGATGDALVATADELKEAGVRVYVLGLLQDSSETERTASQNLLSRIASVGCYFDVDSEEVLSPFFGDIADAINGACFMYITVACPVDVSVCYNGETLASNEGGVGARTSFGTITYVNSVDENGSTTYASDGTIDQVKVLRLREGGRYTVKIKGTGDGTMDYVIGYLDNNGAYTDFRSFPGIDVTTALYVRTTAEVSDQTYLEIDQNGDGVIDRQLFAGPNENGRERDTSPQIMRALMVVGIVGAGIVVVWIGLLVRRLTKRG